MTIKRQLSIIFIIITIVPIGILGIFHSIEIIDFISQSSKNQKYATQRLAESVETYVNFHTNYIDSISFNIAESQNMNSDYMKMLLKGGKTKLPGFIELYISNSDGEIVASYPRNSQNGELVLGEGISNRDHFKEVKATERTVITPILLGRHSKKPLILIASPIIYGAQFQGSVIGTLDLTALKNIITDYDYGTEAYPVVEDQEHKIIYHPVQPSISKNYDVKNLRKQYRLEEHSQGDGEYYSNVYHRYEYLSFETIPSLNWVVYVSKPASAKNESIRNALFLMGFILLVTLLFTQYLSRLLAKRMLEPIKVLIEYSAAIEGESFTLKSFERIQIMNAAREFNLLLHRFYEMGKKVFQNSEEMKKLNRDLERRVSERTEGLVVKNRQLELINKLIYQPMPISEMEKFVTPILEDLSELMQISVTFVAVEEEADDQGLFSNVQFSVPVAVTEKRLGQLIIGPKDEQILNLANQEFLRFFARSLGIVLYKNQLLSDLRNRNAILNTATKIMNDGFVLLTKQYEISYVNDLFAQTLELNRDQIVRRRIEEILPFFPFTKNSLDELPDIHSQDHYNDVHFSIKTKDGKQKHLRVTKFIIHDENENFGFGLVLQDMTKEKEMELLKNQLISFTSHEFKTPITTLSGSIETLMRKDIEWDEEFVDELLLGMIDDVKRLEQLTSDWLDIVKIDSNALVLMKEQTRIGVFIEGVVQGLKKPPFDKAKIIFTRNHLSEYILSFDLKRVEQVVRNIITNAIRYSRGNPTIRMKIHEDEKNILIDFKDNGIGIAREHQEKIFEKFYHVDVSRTRKTGGTGLGLSICKGILDAHGWEIRVVSEINKGSTFTIVIPKMGQVSRYET